MNRKREILSTRPRLVQRESGWLAVSPRGACLRVGVEGATEREARQKFREALAAWATLSELPDRPYVS